MKSGFFFGTGFPALDARISAINSPDYTERTPSAIVRDHELDVAFRSCRRLADRYVPRNERVLIVVVPADAPNAVECPPGTTSLIVPDARDIPEPAEGVTS